MIVLVLLLIINIVIIYNSGVPEVLREVKEKYKILRESLGEEHAKIKDEIPITARTRTNGYIGYNVNKGHEIGLCIDGTANQIFHVLLHELAHCMVDEYSHSKKFWKAFDELRNHAINLGIYERIEERSPFCKKHVQDK